jgi:cytochrome c peroxidase
MRQDTLRHCGLILGLCLGCAAGDRSDDLARCQPSPDNPGVEVCDVVKPAEAAATAEPASADLNPRLLRRFKSLRTNFSQGSPATAAQVDLGRMLYFDARLSRTKTVSCDSCHPLDRYGTTNAARSAGVGGKLALRNAPSTYNAAGQFSQFWDGRGLNVEEQAMEPLLNPDAMGMTPESTVATLTGIPGYSSLFRAAFPADSQPIALKNVAVAIGAFERGLVTPGRWDRYLLGDRSALSEKEKEGLRVFTGVGCMVCHTGELVGGSMYEKLGEAVPWPEGSDRGRAGVTHDPSDDMVFKVPSLRNVQRTAPYFHDGSAKTLEQAVRMMGMHQLGVELTQAEVTSLVAWLSALTGSLPAEYIRRPALPGFTATP